jgi:membrane-bound lytic murein transglycosylase F
MMHLKYLYILFAMAFIVSCAEKKPNELTPWGTSLEGDSIPADNDFNLNDIVDNGELIMLTLTGPENYYDYHGRGLGTQYMLCERFAQTIGVSLRVEVCKDTAELVSRLKDGDGDIAAFQLPKSIKGVQFCGVGIDSLKTQWAVQSDNRELADTLNHWFKPAMIAQVRAEESFLLSTKSITRHVYSPMLSRANGIISKYDKYFQMYAPLARWDWRLMAAQCYQESTFDPRAHSWAGACGLMQIMPSTAAYLGLPSSMMYDPESNIAASAKYTQQLTAKFRDIPDSYERCFFVLACYNGGYNHVRDAMALARKYNKNPYRWGDVSEFVLKLRQPQYYNDPIVRHGYMRGDETVDYVARIRDRWAQYRGVAHGGFSGFYGPATPQKAKRKYRFHI